jgi:hypothetical protein
MATPWDDPIKKTKTLTVFPGSSVSGGSWASVFASAIRSSTTYRTLITRRHFEPSRRRRQTLAAWVERTCNFVIKLTAWDGK